MTNPVYSTCISSLWLGMSAVPRGPHLLPARVVLLLDGSAEGRQLRRYSAAAPSPFSRCFNALSEPGQTMDPFPKTLNPLRDAHARPHPPTPRLRRWCAKRAAVLAGRHLLPCAARRVTSAPGISSQNRFGLTLNSSGAPCSSICPPLPPRLAPSAPSSSPCSHPPFPPNPPYFMSLFPPCSPLCPPPPLPSCSLAAFPAATRAVFTENAQ